MQSAQRARGREHIPNYPKGFIVLRVFQLVFALINISIASYAMYGKSFAGGAFTLFTGAITWIVTLWLVNAHSCVPRVYNYWAVLVFDILLYIFWLVAFITMALEAVVAFSGARDYSTYDVDDYDVDDYDVDDFDYDDYDYDYYNGIDSNVYGAVLAAGACFGAIEYLLFFISLVIHSVVVCRHRRAGLHSHPVSAAAAAAQHHPAPIQMVLQPSGPGAKPAAYEAVPQHGIPVTAQDTAYNPAALYGPPQPQPQPQPQQQFLNPHGANPDYYGASAVPAPVAPQHTGGSFGQPALHGTPSPPPPQGVQYQQPYQPYRQ